MTWRKVVASLCAALLVCAVSCAAVCPLCLQQIPDGERYCARCKAQMLAEKLTSGEEQKLADDAMRARAAYEAKLAALETYYESRGNAERLIQVRKERKDEAESRHFEYVHWEDRLPELSATNEVPEATGLLKEADATRTAINPFNRGDRYKQAAVQYQQILIKYPNSTAVDSAAFGLGEIYSSSVVGEPARAVKLYKLAYLANPETRNDAVYRAAQVCDNDLSEYEHAAHYYWLAAKQGKSLLTRKEAAFRLGQLQKKDFGTSYSLDERTPEPAVAPANAKPPRP
jgi:TolA-binding protein